MNSSALNPCADTEGTRNDETSKSITTPFGSGQAATREAIQKCLRCLPIFMFVALLLTGLHSTRFGGVSAQYTRKRTARPGRFQKDSQPGWFASISSSQQNRAAHRVRRYQSDGSIGSRTPFRTDDIAGPYAIRKEIHELEQNMEANLSSSMRRGCATATAAMHVEARIS